jgi:hypothetical protein
VLADLAVGPRGEAIVLLADGVGGTDATGPTRLLVVTRGAAPGSGFTAPELVADKAGLGSSVAFDLATTAGRRRRYGCGQPRSAGARRQALRPAAGPLGAAWSAHEVARANGEAALAPNRSWPRSAT